MDSSIMLEKSFTLASFQFYFRIITFFINLFLVRYLERDILGIVNVRLILLYTTIVFITREPFRKVCLGLTTEKRIDRVINLTWLILPISFIISLIFSIIWSELFTVVGYTEYRTVVKLYGLAACIELASEPLWLFGQMNLLVTLRVVIEASAILSKTIISTLLYFMWPFLGLYAFGIAQIIYSLIVTISYYIYFYLYFSHGRQKSSVLQDSIKTYRQLFPCLFPFEIEPAQIKMIIGFVLNCVLKQALTEGERYLMTISSWISLEMQGEYDIVSNLGSLAPRLVFSSIEDSCHLAFSKMLRQGSKGIMQDSTSLNQSFKMLTITLKIVIFLGMTILVFAQGYSWPLLVLYAGLDKATYGAPLLRVFALYVLLLAINGVTECFYYSVISQRELKIHTYRMVGFSIVFLICGGIFVNFLGTVGVIWANCVNMLLRIFISLRFIRHFYKDTNYSLSSLLADTCPHLTILIAYAVSLIVTLLSMMYFESTFVGQVCHVAIGALAFCFMVGIVLCKEVVLLTFLRDKFRLIKIKKS